jgi:hypothetical protein
MAVHVEVLCGNRGEGVKRQISNDFQASQHSEKAFQEGLLRTVQVIGA